MSLMEAYFDESGTHAGSAVVCLAGFILDSEAAEQMEIAWVEMLQVYGLPFFHMVDCAHGSGYFKKLSEQERVAAQTRAIELMRTYITRCFVVSVVPEVIAQVAPSSPLLGSPYSICAHCCLLFPGMWADANNYNGKINYLFESGHRSQSEANAIMNKVFSFEELVENYRYNSHKFADKRELILLQAADIIAWLWHTECKRKIEQKRPRKRKDLQTLMAFKDGMPFFAGAHIDSRFLQTACLPIMLDQYPLTYPWRQSWKLNNTLT